MTPNRQNPAYAILVCHPYPAARQMRRRRHQRQRPGIKSMVLVSAACGSKSEANISTAPGGWPANFERLRETKDLSARESAKDEPNQLPWDVVVTKSNPHSSLISHHYEGPLRGDQPQGLQRFRNWPEPGFPAEFGRAIKLNAAFREESRT
jgi:hypothetical protein